MHIYAVVSGILIPYSLFVFNAFHETCGKKQARGKQMNQSWLLGELSKLSS